jgi:hypothetical protein
MKNKDPYYRGGRAKTIEYYWQDFLAYSANKNISPDETAFWIWYIGEDGPLGVHLAGRWYTRRYA